MTDEQRKLSAILRKWAKYARTAGTPEAVEVTAADLAAAVEFTGGEFTRKDYRPYQSFRARLINNPELLAEFDARRENTRAAFAPVEYGNEDERNLERLADALDTEADYVEGLDLQDGQGKPDLIGELKPDKSKHDAREYCARVLLHVWNTGEHGGKRKSADYVFIMAKRGASLFADIQHARTLKDKWGLATGGIMERAAELHATQGGGKHKGRDGMERPETMRQAAKKSRADERKKMGAEGKRRGGRKR